MSEKMTLPTVRSKSNLSSVFTRSDHLATVSDIQVSRFSRFSVLPLLSQHFVTLKMHFPQTVTASQTVFLSSSVAVKQKSHRHDDGPAIQTARINRGGIGAKHFLGRKLSGALISIERCCFNLHSQTCPFYWNLCPIISQIFELRPICCHKFLTVLVLIARFAQTCPTAVKDAISWSGGS